MTCSPLSRLDRVAFRLARFNADLSGRVAVVTGAKSGMGQATAQELARMGAEVIRDDPRLPQQQLGEAARSDIVETTRNHAVTVMRE